MVNPNNSPRRWQINGEFLGCVVLAVVFGTAAVAKIQKFPEFLSTLTASHLIPNGYEQIVGKFIVSIEIIILTSLFFQKYRKIAINLVLFLCSAFISYSFWRWIQDISVPCHCFGTLFSMAPWQSAILNSVLLLIAILISLKDSSTKDVPTL